jgi:hypothetical protein
VTPAVAPVDEPAGLTPDWMQSALRAAGFDVAVTRVDACPVGTGQMSVSLRARYTVASPVDGLPGSVIVKLPSPDRAVRQLACGGYRAEIAFYEELASTVAIRAPRCHLAVANSDASSFTLVLEDLSPAVPGDQVAGATVNAVAAAARNLAGLHGPRWCDPSLRDARWLRPSGPGPHRGTAGLVARALPQLAERLGPALSAADRATLERSAAALPAFLAARPDRFAPIHGDYRLDNLLFGPGDEVSAVDWQSLSLGLPARDLAYLIGTCLSVADRRAVEADVVGVYWDELVRYGVAGYSRAECFDDYRLGLLHCPLIIVLGAAYGIRTERGDAMFAAMIQRSCQAIRDLGTLAAVDDAGGGG